MSLQQGVQKVLLVGANGQVGHALKSAGADINTPFEWHVSTRADLDVSNLSAVKDLVRALKPNWIVNAAAYTAVDKAELEPQLAQRINADLPDTLAIEAKALGAAVVHYSTDYVFDGQAHRPYAEADQPNPQSAYGRSKWEGEQAVTAHCEKYLVLRTCWVHGAHGGNFLKTMLRLAQESERLTIIDDQWGAPTGADLLADVTAHAIRHLAQRPQDGGLHHCVAAGETNWHQYAQAVLALATQLQPVMAFKANEVAPVPTSAFPTPAQRPLNSRLNTARLQATFGLKLPHWRDGVARMLAEIL